MAMTREEKNAKRRAAYAAKMLQCEYDYYCTELPIRQRCAAEMAAMIGPMEYCTRLYYNDTVESIPGLKARLEAHVLNS
jgi:hypothetical protein|tara:strand:- start:972 stop:1208 length:237 start_codon:yes stop_codon:yes gene_type:complete